MIVPKVITTGDFSASTASLGFGKKELRKLKKDMSFQGINEAYRDLNPFPGVFVRVASSFSLEYIHIHSVSPTEEGEYIPIPEKEDKEKYLTCPCFPCFSFGIIMAIRTVPTDEAYRDGIRFAYDMIVCNGESYLYFASLEVLATGWEEYYVGQFVLVTIDVLERDDELPLCCSNKACLLSDPFNEDKLVPACFTISPIYSDGFMQQWIEL